MAIFIFHNLKFWSVHVIFLSLFYRFLAICSSFELLCSVCGFVVVNLLTALFYVPRKWRKKKLLSVVLSFFSEQFFASLRIDRFTCNGQSIFFAFFLWVVRFAYIISNRPFHLRTYIEMHLCIILCYNWDCNKNRNMNRLNRQVH